jgi:REP element-mobilizing transposase RayT
MPQSFSSILLHIVFSTKNREPIIKPEIEPELFSYMNKLYKESGSPCLTINGTADHVHALCSLGRTTTVADLVEVVKKRSSKWIKTKGREYREYQWQIGYGAFSIGQSNVQQLTRYIARQKARHTKVTYKEELLDLLHKYQIEFDERYIWD